MKLRTLLVAATLLSISHIASAGGTSDSLIKGYVLVPQTGGGVALYISPDGTVTGAAACNVTNRFVVDASTAFGKSVLSTVIAAYIAGKEIRLFGSGACSTGLSSNSEGLSKICTRDVPC